MGRKFSENRSKACYAFTSNGRENSKLESCFDTDSNGSRFDGTRKSKMLLAIPMLLGYLRG